MKNSLILLIALFFINSLNAQYVGVNTANPSTTLDVVGNPTNTSIADGIKAPRITLAQLNLKTGYTSSQTGALIYVTDVTGGSTVSATAQVTTIGYHYYDGSAWQSVVSKSGSVVFVATRSSSTTISNNGFNTVPLTTIEKNIGGGVWDTSNYTYKVPSSGTYMIKSTIRLADASTARDVFQAVNTSNVDFSEGIWQTSTTSRWSMLYNRIAYFNKGDLLRLYIYSDGPSANLIYASLNIVQVSQN